MYLYWINNLVVIKVIKKYQKQGKFLFQQLVINFAEKSKFYESGQGKSWNKTKQDIKSLSTELKAASLYKRLKESNKRLMKALDKGNFAKAKIVQGVIEGVIKLKEQGKYNLMIILKKNLTKIKMILW